jgi:hypothetical protein
VGIQGRPDREGVAGRGDERVRQHHLSNTNPVDRGVLERSLQLQHGRWRIGRPEGRVCQGLFQGATEPQGWIRDRGLHGSASQAGACVPRPDSISGKAKPDNCYHG